MTTRNVARPFPVRIEPVPDEAWSSYTRRVARAMGVRNSDLYTGMEYIDPPHLPQGTAVRTTARMIPVLAKRFRLAPEEVQSMFLHRFSAIPGCQPLQPDDPSPWRARHIAAGWLRMTYLPSCPDCQNEDPELTRITQYLTLCLICTRHGQFITSRSTGSRPAQGHAQKQPTPQQIAWQLRVFHAATQPDESSKGWLELQHSSLQAVNAQNNFPNSAESVLRAAALTGWTSGQESILTTWLATDPESRTSFERAVYAQRNEPLAQGLVELPKPDKKMLCLAYGGTPHPDRLPVEPWLRLMPQHLYQPHISDLSWPAPDREGRASAALVARGYLFGCSLRDVYPYGVVLETTSRLLHRLQQEGRLETYTTLCAQAAEHIGKQPKTPFTPAQLEPLETLLPRLRHVIPDQVTTQTLTDWIDSHWLNHQAPSGKARSQAVKALDHEFGPSLRAAAAEGLKPHEIKHAG